MSTNYPVSLDSFTNPTGGQPLNSPDHAGQHSNINDSVAALEAKVGINSSAVNTTQDYKLSGVTTGDKAVSKTGTETLTNKTLTSPVINAGSDATGDIYYRNSGGAFTRLPIGSASQILAVSSGLPAWIANPSASNASTTVAGIVEEATAAEITAGTATGGTGAILVVTPDQLALSTPVFNASSLTSLPNGFLSSGAPGTTTTNTTATVLTYALAGGVLSTNRGVRLRFTATVAVTATNSGATYTVQYGGTTIGTFGYAGSSGTPTVTVVIVADMLLLGSGATNTQRGNSFFNFSLTSGSGGAISAAQVQSGSLAVDSTTSQNITVSCNAGGSVTGTLVDYFIQKAQ